MTRQEAVVKINKLRRLAARAGSPQEAENAKRTASEIRVKFGLTENDLAVSAKAEAFDDILGRIDAHARKSPDLPPPVFEVISGIKKETSEEDKAKGLEKLVGIVRIGALLFGGKIRPIKSIIEDVLKKHELTI